MIGWFWRNKWMELYGGGYTGTAQAVVTEFFNGSSWTELNDLSQGSFW
jgi:hypothetical protein